MAENLPADSYLKVGNRGVFAEAQAVALHVRPERRSPPTAGAHGPEATSPNAALKRKAMKPENFRDGWQK